MEPISALLVVAGAHGAGALVRALSGSSDLAGLSTDLFKALSESESRIDARLSNIEDLLDELLEQRYQVALSSGVRLLFDALSPATPTPSRVADLDRARQWFVEAASATHSSLQRAIAERYLLLTLLGQDRTDLVPASLSKVDGAATAAAFDAVALYCGSWSAASDLLRHRGVRRPRRGPTDIDPIFQAQRETESAAEQIINMCARLLAETSLLAPVFDQPMRLPPQINGPKSFKPAPWQFTFRKGLPIRIGCITAAFVSAPTDTKAQVFTFDLNGRQVHEECPVAGYLRLKIDPPLPRHFFVQSTDLPARISTLGPSPGHLMHYQLITAGTSSIDVPLPGQPPPESVISHMWHKELGGAVLVPERNSFIGLIHLHGGEARLLSPYHL